MATQFVEVKDFPGMTLEDALKIAVHRLTQNGYDNVEAEPDATERGGRWLLAAGISSR